MDEAEIWRAVTENEAANDTLREFLLANRSGARNMMEAVLRGRDLAHDYTWAEATANARRYQELLASFETARKRMRQVLLAVGNERGMSASSMAQLLGVSRQYTVRMAAEVRSQQEECAACVDVTQCPFTESVRTVFCRFERREG